MNQDIIAANLAAVEAHFGSEATGRVDAAIDLYTDDIVWEAPARNLVFKGKKAVADNYREMFSGFKNLKFRTLDRFATEDRVVDDSVVSFELTKKGFFSLPVGAKCEMRLTHIFEMRGGKISKEIGIETPPKVR
jgi:ketosteroid isomerase-like protein